MENKKCRIIVNLNIDSHNYVQLCALQQYFLCTKRFLDVADLQCPVWPDIIFSYFDTSYLYSGINISNS